jgi:putative flippase GtrA
VIGLISRFGLAGFANTLFGLTVIAAVDLGLGVPSNLANAAGYGLGVILAFVLNRSFVFRSRERAQVTGPRFVLAAVAAFILNQLVLTLALRILGDAEWARLAAQLVGMGTYTASLFLACRFWVFAPLSPPSPSR